MEEFFTTLGIDVKVEGAAKAETDLKKVAKAGEEVEKSTDKAGKQSKNFSDVLKGKVDTLNTLQGKLQQISQGGLSGFGTALEVIGSRAGIVAAGIGLVIGALATLTAATIAANDQLGDLSEELGVSVEELDKMRQIARITGTSFESVTGMLTKFQKSVGEAADGTGKQAEAFRALGLEANGSNASMEDVAKRLMAMAPGVERNHLATVLLGRSVGELTEFMGLYARGADVSAKVTNQNAQEAGRLAEAWDRLKNTMSNWGTEIANPVISYLDIMLTKFSSLKTYWQEFSLLNPSTWDPNVAADKALEMQRVKDGIKFGPENFDSRDRALNNSAALQAALARAAEESGKAQVKAAGDAASAIKALEKELSALEGKWKMAFGADEAGVDVKTIEGLQELDRLLAAGRLTLDQYTKGIDKLLDSDSKLAAEQKKINEQYDAEFKALQKLEQENQKRIDQRLELVDSVYEYVAASKEESDTVNMTAEQLIKYNAELERQKIIKSDLSSESQQYLIGLVNEGEQYRLNALAAKTSADQTVAARKDLQQQEAALWANAERIANNFFEDLFDNGTKAFQNLGNSLKKFFLNLLYELTIKKWFVNIGVGISGAGGASSALGGGGGGGMPGLGDAGSFLGISNPFGSGFSLANNTWGGGAFSTAAQGAAPGEAIGSFSGSFSSSFGASLSSALGGAGIGAGIGMVGSALFGNERNSTNMQIGGTVGGAIGGMIFGPIGAIIGGVLGTALGSLFKKGGGPKTGGFGSSGDIGGAGRFFTPNQEDAAMGELAKGVQSSFASSLKALGGTGEAGFAFGFDTDPKGTANSRVSAGAFVNGKQVYSAKDIDAGRTEEELKKAIDLESKRALLAALQASDLPKDVAAILNMADAGSASAETIEKLISFGTAMNVVGEALSSNPIEDALNAIAEASKTAQERLVDQGDALRVLGEEFDGSIESSNKLAQATAQYRANVVAVIAAMEQLKKSISNMFDNSIASWTRDTMGEQERYDSLIAEANRLRDEMKTTTSADVIQRNSERINQLMNEAWGMLDETQRAAKLQEFIDGAEAINTLATERLTELQESLATEMETLLTDLHTNMMTVATAMQKAADTLNTAAEKPVKLDVNVKVDSNGNSEVTTNGGGG